MPPRSVEAAAPFRSLLYREPWLYDLVFPADDRLGGMCRQAWGRYLATVPRSVLDVGCGTGRLLQSLSTDVPECWGVDLLASNIEYARSVRPGLRLFQDDMRSFRLGRTFDAVTSFGNALSYALTDQDLRRTVESYRAHAHRGTLLIVDVLNARSYLDGDGFRERIESRVDTPEFRASAVSIHSLDRARRLLVRTRVWRIPGRPDVEDHAEYRLLYPEELAALLEVGGFEVVGLFDNRELLSSGLRGAVAAPDASGMSGRKLYCFARRRIGTRTTFTEET
jgi:SAM-dependent methyltransferase